ncbi:hypothetical protein Tco_1450635, partial [Tanacetum coccineum]
MMVDLCSPVLHCAINTSPSQSFPKPLLFLPILFSLAMAAHGGRNNIVARRVIDDLIDISGDRSPPKTSTNLISQLNALIAELEASGNYEEVFDLVMELQDD